MTQTDVYIEQKERKQQKKYDSDDDGEPERQGKKKKMKNVARGYPPSLLFLPTCSPDPALSFRVDEAQRRGSCLPCSLKASIQMQSQGAT